MRYLEITEAKSDVATMQPTTPITVFHGTDVAHAMEFCTNGIDARQRHSRLYPHWDRGEYVNRGLFVTTTLAVAISFGNIVLKFTTLAKNLHYQYPSPTSQREADRVYRPDYPKSAHPGTSANLLGPQREKQALFRGLVSPRAIEKVYLVGYDREGKWAAGQVGKYQAAMTPQEFLTMFANAGNKKPYKLAIEPQERLTPDGLLARLGQKYSRESKDGTGWIEDIIRDAIDPSRHETYQAQIQGLMAFAGGTNMPYSAAKHLLPQFLDRFGMAMAPNKYERLKKGPHFG